LLPEYLRKRYSRGDLATRFFAVIIIALMVLAFINVLARAQSTGGAPYQDPDALNRANVMVSYVPAFYGQPAYYSVSVHKNGGWVGCKETKCPKVGRLVFTKDKKALLAKPTRTEYIAGVIRSFSSKGAFTNVGRTSLNWSPSKRINISQNLSFDGELIPVKLISVTVFFDDANRRLTHPEICNDVECPGTMVGPDSN
jgi:hypothetical protein